MPLSFEEWRKQQEQNKESKPVATRAAVAKPTEESVTPFGGLSFEEWRAGGKKLVTPPPLVGPPKPTVAQLQERLEAQSKPVSKEPGWGETIGRAVDVGMTSNIAGNLNLARLGARALDWVGKHNLFSLLTGKKLDTSGIQYLLERPVEQMEDIISEHGERMAEAGPAKQFAHKAVAGVTSMAPELLIGGGLAKGAAGRLGAGIARTLPVAARATGIGAREAEKEGATPLQQAAYGTLVGVAEAATEFLPFEHIFGAIGRPLAKKGIETAAKSGLLGTILKPLVSESLEEAASVPLGNLAKKLIYKPDTKILDWEAMGEEGLVGAASTALLVALGMPATSMANKLATSMAKGETAMTPQNLERLQTTIDAETKQPAPEAGPVGVPETTTATAQQVRAARMAAIDQYTEEVRKTDPREIAKMLYMDESLGIFNSRAFKKRMTDPATAKPVIVKFDLNGLKYVNDKFGHEGGDQLLELFALAGDEAGVVELGHDHGDEFSAGVDSIEQAQKMIDYLNDRYRRAKIEVRTPEGELYEITFTKGAFGYGIGEGDYKTARRAADNQLTAVKNKYYKETGLSRGGKPVEMVERLVRPVPGRVEDASISGRQADTGTTAPVTPLIPTPPAPTEGAGAVVPGTRIRLKNGAEHTIQRVLGNGNVVLEDGTQLGPAAVSGWTAIDQQAPSPPSLKKAAGHAKEAAKESYAALKEIFGGPGKERGAVGFEPGDTTYERVRPHLERAWAEFKAAGGEFKDFIVHMVQEFGEGIRAYLERFRGEVEKRGTEVSRFRTNTIERATMFTDEDRKHLTFEEFEYLPEKNVEQREQAIKNVEADMDAVMRRHEKLPEIGGGVEAFEAAAISQLLVKEARATGDYSRIKRWTRTTSEKAREWGRGMQATGAAYEKMGSPAAAVHKAQRVIDQVHEEAKKRNPARARKIDLETQAVKKELQEIQRGPGDAEAKKKKALEALRKRLLAPDKPARKQKTLFERILKFVEMGAYEDAEIRDLLYEKYGLPVLTNEDVQFIVEQMSLAENLEEDSYEKRAAIARAKKLIADKIPADMKAKFRGLMRITLLSNIKTHIRNIIGNITMGIEALRENTIAPMVDTLTGLVTGARSTIFAPITKGQAFIKGAAKGLVEWGKDIKYGVDTSPTRGQTELPKGRTFKSPLLNFLERSVSKTLELGDRPFYEGWRQSRLAELQKIHKTTEITEEMEIAAHLYALDKVFQNDSAMAKSARDLKKALGWLGEISIPFTQTPANILDKLVDYSPLGLAKGIYHLGQTARKGTFDQKLFTDRISRALTGTGIMMLGYVLAKAGIITGKPPEDKEAREFQKEVGVNPYAFRIGRHYYTYDWMQPVGGMLAAGADFFFSGKDKKSVVEKIGAGAASAVNTVLNQSFLQGLIKLVGGGYGEGPAEGAAKTVMESPLMFLPTLSKQAAQLVDPYVRRAETPAEKAISRIPFASKTLPPKVGALGEPIKAYQGRANVLSVMFSPGFYTKREKDPVSEMVLGLYERTGETRHFPRLVSEKLTIGNVTINLTPEQQNELQRIQGQLTRARFTPIANQKGLTDEKRIDRLQKILTDIAKIAKQRFLREHKTEILKGLSPQERRAVIGYMY